MKKGGSQMELNSLLKDMGLVDAFSSTLSADIEPVDGDCSAGCLNGCYDSCHDGCSTSKK
jgi:hypothetical protein